MKVAAPSRMSIYFSEVRWAYPCCLRAEQISGHKASADLPVSSTRLPGLAKSADARSMPALRTYILHTQTRTLLGTSLKFSRCACPQGVPVFIDTSSKGDVIPTVYALWRAPGILPVIKLKHHSVSHFLLGAQLS